MSDIQLPTGGVPLGVQQTLKQIAEVVTEINTQLGSVEKRLGSVEKRLSSLEKKVDDLQGDVYVVKTMLGIAHVNPDTLRRAVFPVVNTGEQA